MPYQTIEVRKLTPHVGAGIGVVVLHDGWGVPKVGTIASNTDVEFGYQGLALFEMESVAADRHRPIGGQPLSRLLGHCVKFLLQPRTKVLGGLRELEFGISIGAFGLPAHGIIDQVRKGDMATTGRKEEIPRPQAVAHRDSQA